MSESFDFTAVSVQDAPLPKHAGGRKPKYAVNPFRDAVADSYSTETGKAITVPKRMVKDAVALLRRAAAEYKFGIRIIPSVRFDSDEFAKMSDDTNVTLNFQAKPKRAHKTKAAQDADVVATVDTETTSVPEKPQAVTPKPSRSNKATK